MAKATTIKGTDVRLFLGTVNGETITYTAPCGLNGKAIRFSKNTNEIEVPDCADPDEAAWLERDVVSISIDGDGEGVLAAESIESYVDAWQETDPIPGKIEVKLPTKTLTWTGLIHITNFEVNGQRGNRATVSIAFASHGEMSYTTPS